ncbi:DUF2059 domain-containing protein [Helicobacter aurati]|uniref:DUF2059 domain-containing protein n=1 Tax=Helicobacter aurati TaxID=137778 RepID=A0A3D8J8C1_9HELI|nr:DUF2059 domain-containing protein [Helicobacter aurati]RDU73124.1 DUF2059 domain-containing protein [Helicobacter aurati]
MLQHIRQQPRFSLYSVFAHCIRSVGNLQHLMLCFGFFLSLGFSTLLHAHTSESHSCPKHGSMGQLETENTFGSMTIEEVKQKAIKKDRLYYELSGYIRDSEFLSFFDNSILTLAFLSTSADLLKRKKLDNYETFERVLTRDNRKRLVKQRESFKKFAVSYWHRFYSLQEAQDIHDYVRSALGKKELQVEMEIAREITRAHFLFIKTGEVPKLPPFALSADSKADKKKKSLLELIDIKREEPMIDLGLRGLDTALREEFGLSKKEARSRIENLKTVLVEYSLVIKAKHYTQDEIDSLLAFYRSPVGAKSVLLTLQASANTDFEVQSMEYMKDVFNNISEYLESYN